MTVIQHEQHQDTKLSKKYIYKYIVAIFSSQCLHINLYICHMQCNTFSRL